MSSSYQNSKSRNDAFTLIEIMVASVVMIILVGLVVHMTSEVLKIWNRSSGKLSANAEARIAMNLLTQDLESAVFRNNGQQWLRIEGPIDPDGNYTDQTVSLKLFSAALDRPDVDAGGAEIRGDICAIGYRLAYKKSYSAPNAPKVFALYRQVVDAETTFNELMGDPEQQSLTDDLNDRWQDSKIIEEENFLASNIIEFKVFVLSLIHI